MKDKYIFFICLNFLTLFYERQSKKNGFGF